MSSDTPIVVTWHNENLAEFSTAQNGNRHDLLRDCSIKSFSLAKGDDNLSVSKVESDFLSTALGLGMKEKAAKDTLAGTLKAATARDTFSSDKPKVSTPPTTKANLKLAPVYTALEDYALAHGVPVKVFIAAGWTVGKFPYGKFKDAPCLIVPCEDGISRARLLNPEAVDAPKWLPIKPEGMKDKITPCWYGFKGAIAKAAASNHKTIVICNGQPSVVVAQHYGISALAQTDGENKLITTLLFRRLEDAIKEHKLKVLLAYDGDETGRKSTTRIQKQLTDNGITPRIVHFGGDDGYDLADYCKQHQNGVMDKLLRLSRFGQKKLQPVVSRRELVNQAYRTLSPGNKNLPAGEMLVMPFKSISKLGGFAFIMHPGRMSMILAPSGHGKTSFMETLSDVWNKKGFDTLFFSPEWSPLSMQYRTIQRYSGVHTDAIASHVLHDVEVERGIAIADRQGVEIKPDSPQHKAYYDANEDIATWPGEMYALQNQKVTSEILEDMSKTIWIARRAGRRPGAVFFDYVQILRTDQDEKDRSAYETICSEIGDWSKDMDIHVIVGSQPTKSVGESSINSGTLLNEYDAMWMRPDVAQLIITLNIKHNKIGDELIKTDRATVNVCKNNEGKTKPVKLRTHFERLTWMAETRLDVRGTEQ